ncbi:pyridoxamine 5'-phosphate oxidase family protein [Arthrobacter sp. B0490]|uniref:pyridoxamine 5'-phosphate oxidase family protein n=1 Tax=Arthrobacter sp. B0490 TaxID=2058891 RepID=UPI000CE5007A|nr:pyridoxamine 5'-phosphate oxidase family protein [Arthrobacter sp. B0490]
MKADSLPDSVPPSSSGSASGPGPDPTPASEPAPTRVLAAHECWALLRQAPLGRLALCVDGHPEIFPINFVVDHGTLVYRTSEGTKSSAAEKAPAAMEADGFYTGAAPGSARGDDENETRGQDTARPQDTMWSVVVKGRAATIALTSEVLDSVQLPLHPWEGGRKDRFMRLVPETISGRAFTPTPAAADALHPGQAGPQV